MNRLTIVKLLCLSVIVLSEAIAQNTAALTVRVLDPARAAIAGAQVTLHQPLVNFTKQTQTGPDGLALLSNLPLQSYQLDVTQPGFASARQTVELRSNIAQRLEVVLAVGAGRTEVEVRESDDALLVDRGDTGTRMQMNESDIDRLALQVGNRGLESVLLSFPGFSQNANGAIHPRGAHNQMLFVVDGMPITDQLTGAFGNAVDPNIVQTVELFTGNIPAEYGNKVAAVAQVTTKSGLGSGRRLGGAWTMSGAEPFDTASTLLQAHGERRGFGFSTSANLMKTGRYLDQVSLDNLHNGGGSARLFARLDWSSSPRDQWRLNLMGGQSAFELANLRSQQANGMAAKQGLDDASVGLGWTRTLNAATIWETRVSYRGATGTLTPSPGDIPVTARQNRKLETYTVWNRLSAVRGAHQLKAGVDLQRFPVRERFDFGVTDPAFNPPGGEDYIPTLLTHDLSRGGRLFTFAQQKTGGLYSGFVQDQFRWQRFQVAAGLRYDQYRFLVNGGQWQPRVGVSFELWPARTILRASYNRTYQTPPNENLLLSSAQEAGVLVTPNVRATLGGALRLIQPERQNFYEVGLQQALGARFSLNASFYHKDARDQQDNNNFFNTGIIFPTSLASIRVNGAEARAVMLPIKGISATLSATHGRAITTPPFTGGLFIGQDAVNVLSSGPFVIDHDQRLSLHSIVTWTHKRGWFVTSTTRYDSGLVANPSNPVEVAADPDYADLLPYVDLLSKPARTRPRTIQDLVLGYEHTREGRRRWEATVQISNLTNRTALYNFQSIFVGTRLVQPRTAGVRIRWYF
ncbi:MAG: TonB-dependent receptor [Bryobacteraceae bacterium]|nr:TonB-dependent receptor [Bryobacteraceae bacterium]